MSKAGKIGLGLGLWPASCSSFSPSLAPSHHCFIFPGASEPAHLTGGFSRVHLCLPMPWELSGPLALGDWPALVNLPSLSGLCSKAALQCLILPKASGQGTTSRLTLTWVCVPHGHLPAMGPKAIYLTSPSLSLSPHP